MDHDLFNGDGDPAEEDFNENDNDDDDDDDESLVFYDPIQEEEEEEEEDEDGENSRTHYENSDDNGVGRSTKLNNNHNLDKHDDDHHHHHWPLLQQELVDEEERISFFDPIQDGESASSRMVDESNDEEEDEEDSVDNDKIDATADDKDEDEDEEINEALGATRQQQQQQQQQWIRRLHPERCSSSSFVYCRPFHRKEGYCENSPTIRNGGFDGTGETIEPLQNEEEEEEEQQQQLHVVSTTTTTTITESFDLAPDLVGEADDESFSLFDPIHDDPYPSSSRMGHEADDADDDDTNYNRKQGGARLEEDEELDELDPHEAQLIIAHLKLDIRLKQTSPSSSFGWKRLWQTVLGLFAFLDCYASLLTYYYPEPERDHKRQHQTPPHASRELSLLYETMLQPASVLLSLVHQWLVLHGNYLAFLFSFVWFMDAFVLARRQKLKVFNKLDRKVLLWGKQEVRRKRLQARVVYGLSLLVQLLLLPTGFYLFLFQVLGVKLESTPIKEDKRSQGETLSLSLSSALTNSMCLAVFVLQTVAVHCTHRGHEYFHHKIKTVIWDYIWRNIWKPFKFRRRVRSILRSLRWAHYLGPLGGTLGKFHRVCCDVHTVHRQRRRAALASQARRIYRESLSVEELCTVSAVKIQAAYRSRRARKYRYALAWIRGDESKLSDVSFQQNMLRRSFRQGLSIAASRHERLKGVELKSTRAHRRHDQQQQQHHHYLGVNDQQNMYQLRQELQGEVRLGRP
jgi:hypothetical protein